MGYGNKVFSPVSRNDVTRSPGLGRAWKRHLSVELDDLLEGVVRPVCPTRHPLVFNRPLFASMSPLLNIERLQRTCMLREPAHTNTAEIGALSFHEMPRIRS